MMSTFSIVENIFKLQDLQSFCIFIAVSFVIYLIGRSIISISASLWGSLVFIIALYTAMTPPEQNEVIKFLQPFLGGFLEDQISKFK
jgi:hypothetical protein